MGILAGGGLVPESVPALQAVGVREFHASCRSDVAGDVEPKLTELGFALGNPRATDVARVRAYISAIA